MGKSKEDSLGAHFLTPTLTGHLGELCHVAGEKGLDS